MPWYNQAGKRRSARLNNKSVNLQSQLSLPIPVHPHQLPMTPNMQSNQNMSQPPMNSLSANIKHPQTNQSSIPLEKVNEDNKAYWDNYYEYNTPFGWVPHQSSETEPTPEQYQEFPQPTTPPMKAEYNRGPTYDYYNDPSYVTTNEEANRYMNDPRNIVSTSPAQPVAEERVVMLEEEIRQLMDTNRTLQKSICEVQHTLASMAITKQVQPLPVLIQWPPSSASNLSHSSNRASTPSSVSAGLQFQRQQCTLSSRNMRQHQPNVTSSHHHAPTMAPQQQISHQPNQLPHHLAYAQLSIKIV